MATKRVHGTRRVWLPAGVLAIMGFAVIARLVQVQILEHDRYAAQAAAELEGSSTMFAQRGAILDRNGNVLASSVDTWDIYVNSRAWSDPADAAEASEILAEATGQSSSELRQRVFDSGLIDVIVARDIPYEVGRDLIEQSPAGVIALPNTNRIHPEDDLAAGLIGITGLDNGGLSGVEASLNETLQGTPGRAVFERDTSGEPIPYGQYLATDPVKGSDVILTIDRYLQQLAETTLAEAVEKHEAKGGTILMMDPYSGDILALATLPSLRYSELNLDDPEQVALMRNRAATDLYEPGSVMKVVTAAAAIDAGKVTQHTVYHDTGTIMIYDTPIRNWDLAVYGDQTMTGVLQHSINTGAVYMAQLLGADLFHQYLDRFGFGQPTGIELSGEATGIHRRPNDPAWTAVDLATQSFGQAISVTPVQMTSAIAATINGGRLLKPRLVKAYIGPDGERKDVPSQVLGRPISEHTSDIVREMMVEVVYPDWDHPGAPDLYTAGGKSGTADIPIPNGTYSETQVASFIGFAPADDPKVLILVKLDDNADLLTGTQAAGPVFAELVDATLTHMNVPPDAARYTEAR